jgi:ABC-type branched-subunit amino acid transport system ATPase component
MDVAFALADRITVLHQGRLIADGGVAAIRSDPLVSAIYLGAD